MQENGMPGKHNFVCPQAKAPEEGEEIVLETSGCIRSMQVDRVERTEQKGW